MLAIDYRLIIAEYIEAESIRCLVVVVESSTKQIRFVTYKNKEFNDTIFWNVTLLDPPKLAEPCQIISGFCVIKRSSLS